MNTIKYFFISCRPVQWIKNGFIILPLFFAQKILHFPSLLIILEALVIFSLMSSGVYILNDIFDLEADRKHPLKKYRPIAAGLISIRQAIFIALSFLIIALMWGFYINVEFFLVLIIYLVVQGLYNSFLKTVAILDIFCISSGFFLRVIAGTKAINIQESHWLIICTILISMFLTIAKRRHELIILGESGAKHHRKVLSGYSTYFLDQMINVITGSTLLSYMLYSIAPETIEKFNTNRLIYTFPFVLYGIMRYLYLMHQKKEGGAPEKILISDLPLIVCILLWGTTSFLIIYKII